MILKSVVITDFRSVKGTITLLIDPRVTTLLGSNDHGKSNLLRAIQTLNDDRPLTDDDRNWDATTEPSVEFIFQLSEAEQDHFNGLMDEFFDPEGPVEAVSDAATKPEKPAAASHTREQLAEAEKLNLEYESREGDVVFTRRGIGTPLGVYGLSLEPLPKSLRQFLVDKKPRVELFKALEGNLQDSVKAAELMTDAFEFMQGLFFYAGFDPRKAEPLFTQDDRTDRLLEEGSEQLDKNLRKLWGQGTDLTFCLKHRGSNIEFLADDPTIKGRKARMSKRSDGVTQFFRTSIVLHARQRKHPANAYLYLFDEPGVYLHPQGQKDLLQVFEQLAAESSQIVLATHSLFMLNQNFPERHRLIRKTEVGTEIDAKPHRANWRLEAIS